VQDALVAAARRWPETGVPDNPRAWLLTVASRRLVDQVRSERARRDREVRVATGSPPSELLAGSVTDTSFDDDDTLTLLYLCCHPALSPPSQLALTLRAVGGLTTAEIANAFFVPEATMAQRVSRAKQRIRDTGARFAPTSAAEQAGRRPVVLHVLYLIFNEGYTSTASGAANRVDLTDEAIRLARQVRQIDDRDGEASGLLALMLLTEARRPARMTSGGDIVPLAEQDRSRWDRMLIDEGVALLTAALADHPPGSYMLQAAIAALHDEAATPEDTDWPQVVGLYDLLDRIAPSPMGSLSRIVAVGQARGAEVALAELDALASDERVTGLQRFHAVRAHLLEKAGQLDDAIDAYREAARRSTSAPERRYLDRHIAELRDR
jgi:RNA polymerase sigma factor (sigma-70 family)